MYIVMLDVIITVLVNKNAKFLIVGKIIKFYVYFAYKMLSLYFT